MRSRFPPDMHRSFAGAVRKVARLGRIGIKLGLSSTSWKMLLRAIGSRMRARPAVQPSGAITKKTATKKTKEERKNLSTRMLFLLGDFRTAMDQALGHLESRPDDAEMRLLVVGCAIELRDFECAERHMSLVDASRLPDGAGRQLPFFRYTLTRRDGSDGPEPAVPHLDDLYLAMGCRPIRMSRNGSPGVFDSLTSVASAGPRCGDGYFPLSDGPLVSVVMTAYNVEHLVGTAARSILEPGLPQPGADRGGRPQHGRNAWRCCVAWRARTSACG